jgi:hypothetical protein
MPAPFERMHAHAPAPTSRAAATDILCIKLDAFDDYLAGFVEELEPFASRAELAACARELSVAILGSTGSLGGRLHGNSLDYLLSGWVQLAYIYSCSTHYTYTAPNGTAVH